VPWIVFGSGVAVAAFGGLVELKARGDMDDFERSVAANCGNAGCSGGQLAALRDQESSAKLEDKIAIGIAGVGVGALITGGVLFYMNRGKTIERDVRVGITPRGVVVGARF
jgi:hypothetical protein